MQDINIIIVEREGELKDRREIERVWRDSDEKKKLRGLIVDCICRDGMSMHSCPCIPLPPPTGVPVQVLSEQPILPATTKV